MESLYIYCSQVSFFNLTICYRHPFFFFLMDARYYVVADHILFNHFLVDGQFRGFTFKKLLQYRCLNTHLDAVLEVGLPGLGLWAILILRGNIKSQKHCTSFHFYYQCLRVFVLLHSYPPKNDLSLYCCWSDGLKIYPYLFVF